ncbi:hypothetical protein ACFSTE_14885 [Aquimarina hainanensis]|uniref:RHS repeat-associated core domain-containing protein n=1 Tax=Aquimarina hainanensis TaxID=1578017 RepID=A0ABW5NAS3_9FLAO
MKKTIIQTFMSLGVSRESSSKDIPSQKTKGSHRAIALFFVCVFLQTLIPYNQLWANNNGPNAPEAASFEPVDATDMVNLLTGDMSYVLPLLNVPSPEGGYPLALAYHAGIAMDQEASWVGLGWNLNPGAINRYVSGVPDDWKNKRKYTVFYDEGGTFNSYTGGVNVGWGEGVFSAGLYASYSENQSSNGENSRQFGVGITGGVGPFSGSLSTTGASLGISVASLLSNGDNVSSGVGLSGSINQSFLNGNTTLDASISASLFSNTDKNLSTGISLSSRNGLSGSMIGYHFKLSGFQSISKQTSILNNSFTAYIPIPISGGLASLKATFNKTKYWVYENDYYIFNGALYAGNTNNSLNNTLFDYKVAFDSYESFYRSDNKFLRNEAYYSGISYDSYSVSGQGISGNIKPYIFEDAILLNQLKITDNEGGTVNSVSYDYPLGTTGDRFTKNINDIHFYFNNENSSFLKVSSDHWDLSRNTLNSIFDLNTSNPSFNSLLTINGKNYNGYNSNSKRMRKGSYIETFTNQEIIDNPSSILKPYSFNRTRERIPKEGIGAYQVTTPDGKTYHYSLPVYQHEKFSRTSEINNDLNKHFFEEQQLEPYATHWLLTAITGPDYIDLNNNYLVDEGDYGYWVGFDYGMWSEGFGWRTPKNGYEASEKTKVYEWGIKEIYYLDKIKTRTHTALFVKSPRLDNMSSSSTLNVGTKDNPKVYNDIHINSFYIGDDGKTYFSGIYDKILPRDGTHRIESTHTFFLNLNPQRSLKLDKIILLKNSGLNKTISKTNSSEQSEFIGGEIKIDEYYEQFSILGQRLGKLSNLITNRNWKANLFRNILDSKDIIEQSHKIDNVIKTIEFKTSYELAKNSPNSANSGRLTLKKLFFSGRNGNALVPPYSFSYKNINTPFNKNLKDDWGYISNSPQSWSLNKIITPLGASINIEYEEDKFQYEAAITSPSETNKNGGGIRVKNLYTELEGERYITSYRYNIPGTNTSSGVTSYAPSKKEKEVKFIGDIPSPSVMYEYVEVAHKYATNNVKHKNVYHFNVLKKMTEKSNGFELGKSLSLRKTQNIDKNITINGENHLINFSKFELIDHTASLGSMISKKSYNGKGQLLSKIENEYYSIEEIQQGAIQETNKIYKKGKKGVVQKNYLSSSSKTSLPNVLKSTLSYSKGQESVSYFDTYDFLTGQNIETRSILANNVEAKSVVVPAFHKYTEMGAKADNLTNKNMLSQQALSLAQIKVGNEWKTIGAGITTWSNDWLYMNTQEEITEPLVEGTQKIWRKHAVYTWKGDIDANGAYVNYQGIDDNFKWTEAQTNPKWVKTSSIDRYDHYSTPLQTSDINNNFFSRKMGDKESKIIAIADAKYSEMYYSGAEYRYPNPYYFDGGVGAAGASGNGIGQTSEKSHTGSYSVKVNTSIESFKVTMQRGKHRAGKYKISVWVDKANVANARVSVNGQVKPFNGERIDAKDWVLLNHYEDFTISTQNIAIKAAQGIFYADDFRIHPVESNMTSYVYNEWDELTHIIGSNNLATRYEYDDAGRLIKTFVEVVDAPGLTGGFKKAAETNYSYKSMITLDQDGDGVIDPEIINPPISASISLDTSQSANPIVYKANVQNGSGEYQYRWNNGSWSASNVFYGYQCGAINVSLSVKDVSTNETVTTTNTFQVPASQCQLIGGDDPISPNE